MNQAHTFVGVEIPRTVVESLGGLQRAIERTIKAEGGVVHTVPKRVLALPLDDLGVVHAPALEAAEMAMRRAAATMPPFSVPLKGLRAAAIDGGLSVAIGVDDPGERLVALRAALHRGLVRYGFPVADGEWTPHVPLARAQGVARLPDIDERGGAGTVRVRRLALFRRRAGDRPGRFRVVAACDLQRAAEAEAGPDDDGLRAEIAAALDARLARRMSELKTTRARRKRRRAG